MIETRCENEGRETMLLQPSNKNDLHDNICDELLREKAAVLSRAGFAVEDVLQKMACIHQEIETKISLLRSSVSDLPDQKILQRKLLIIDEINLHIDEFNHIRQKAELQFYYLIVTREALGLRRHQAVQDLYRIPEKKKKIQAY
jgi:hypothetical protein